MVWDRTVAGEIIGRAGLARWLGVCPGFLGTWRARQGFIHQRLFLLDRNVPPAQDSSNIAYCILHRRAQEPSRKGAGRAKARRDGEACQAGRLPRAPCAPPRAARFAQLS